MTLNLPNHMNGNFDDEVDQFLRIFDQARTTLDSSSHKLLPLICNGTTNRTMARQLNVGTRTIESRRAKVLRVFGVHNATELSYLIGKAEAYRECRRHWQSM